MTSEDIGRSLMDKDRVRRLAREPEGYLNA